MTRIRCSAHGTYNCFILLRANADEPARFRDAVATFRSRPLLGRPFARYKTGSASSMTHRTPPRHRVATTG